MSDKYLGDFEKGQTLRVKFNTFSQALVPTTPSVNPTVAIYKDSATEFTTGVTQPTVDYDSKAGLHELVIDTSDSVYEVGKDYDIVFTAGTVDGVDLTRTILRTFSIENRNIDANVVKIAGETANAAAAVTFPASVASEATVGNIETDTQDIQSRIPAALVGGRIAANAEVVSDKTGFKLASDGLALVTSWTVDITGSLSGSVGSISGVTFPSNFAALGINASGHISRVVLVDTTTTNTDMRGTDGAALATNWTATRAGYLDGVLIAANYNQRTVTVTGSNHVAADIHELQPAVIDNTHFAAGAIDANAIATDAIDADALAASANTEIANAVAATQALSRLDSMIESDGAGQFRFDTIAVSLASQGGGGGAVNISVEDQSITVC